MIDTPIFVFIVWTHFVADFLLQTDQMALNKSSSIKWLTIHSVIYMIPFVFFGFLTMFLIGITHFIVDYITSKWTTKLWLANKRHWFFCVIGLDQTIHFTSLVWLIEYFYYQ